LNVPLATVHHLYNVIGEQIDDDDDDFERFSDCRHTGFIAIQHFRFYLLFLTPGIFSTWGIKIEKNKNKKVSKFNIESY